MLWCTATISAPPNPASAIWSISRRISAGSTRPSGHHQRNRGRTAAPGRANPPGPACGAAWAAASPPRTGAAPAATAAAVPIWSTRLRVNPCPVRSSFTVFS
ncbi:hypothetical protein ACFQY7_20025 [Actinomadura luteofluorescens]|uniref:hypothetical protein n=1 Tax=Actinomadura luteofluorescens TaxID=46163 RepID=UPI00363B54A1